MIRSYRSQSFFTTNLKLKKVKNCLMKIILTHSKGNTSNHYFPINMSTIKATEKYKSILAIKSAANFIPEASAVVAHPRLIKSILSLVWE
jgi:hypothetical protein